jgi:hypothetical protein
MTGGGTRTDPPIPLASLPQDMQLADVNRDGILDVLTSHYQPMALSVRLGNGAGGFGASTDVALPSQGAPFGVGDLNHDGRPDVAMTTGGNIVVVLGMGDGGWAAPAQFAALDPWDTPDGTILGDFNGDGHLDVFTSGATLVPGHGDGTFGPAAGFAANLTGGLATDWNRDGLLDVVTAWDVTRNERRSENRPPFANAGPDSSFSYPAQFRQDDGSLDGGASTDPDMHRLSYEWRDETGDIFGYSQWASFPAKRPGTYTFTLTVRDGRGGEDTDSLQVTILPYTEIVLHTGRRQTVGNWRTVDDTSAAAGARLFYPDGGAPKVNTPFATPPGYVDVSFTADPTQTYKLWVRLKAQNNSFNNDSIWLQFSGVVNGSGQPAYRIGTTDGLPVNLEECSGCGISAWGWEDDGWGAVNRNGVLLRFPDGGHQTIRIQVREDGVSVDQIVLSSERYLTARPGSAKNDALILPSTEEPFDQ